MEIGNWAKALDSYIQEGIPEIPPHESVFIIDASWVAYRSAYTFKTFSVTKPSGVFPTGVFYGFVKLIKTIKKSYPGALIFFCIDTKPTINNDLVEGYKEGRSGDRPDVHPQIEAIMPYLASVPNVYILREEGVEADSLPSALLRFYQPRSPQRQNNKFFVYTSDMDAYQVVRENVWVFQEFDKGEPVSLGADYCEQQWAKPYAMPMYKAIRGKGSDALPPIMERFPTALAKRVSEEFPTLELLEEGLSRIQVSDSQQKYINAIKDKWEEVKKRYQLSRHTPCQFRPFWYAIPKSRIADFIEFFSMNSMRSLF